MACAACGIKSVMYQIPDHLKSFAKCIKCNLAVHLCCLPVEYGKSRNDHGDIGFECSVHTLDNCLSSESWKCDVCD
jgi:hypothetical protein